MKKLLLASLCLAVGLARVPAMAADSAADATASAANRFWAEAEYLRWTVKGDKLPALVTTSPPGTPPAQRGVLGFPGTAVLFGDSTVNDGWRSGGRAGAGFWFDDRRTSGIETSFFQLGTQRPISEPVRTAIRFWLGHFSMRRPPGKTHF